VTTLGDILGTARRSAAKFERWIESADPELAQAVKAAAASCDQSPAGFARGAVADFSRYADEEAWAQLTRIVRDHENPGAACLASMVRWRLSAKCCASHSVNPVTGAEDEQPV
jgi:hypothetical protein